MILLSVVGSPIDIGLQGIACDNVNAGTCVGFDETDITSYGATDSILGVGLGGIAGIWSIAPESVPSLTTWGIIFLVLSLLFFSQKRMGLLQVQKSRK